MQKQTSINTFNSSKTRGIALIQVLIISIILTMLGIYINQTVRSQIAIVSLMKNSLELSLALENEEAKLLHMLLTEPNYHRKESKNSYLKKWNFYGKPFAVNKNTTVVIQDLSSLLSVNTLNNTLAQNLIKKLGYSGHKVRTLLDSLADWKDADNLVRLNGAENDYYRYINKSTPRNGYLQTLGEIENVQHGSLLTSKQWQAYFTDMTYDRFNPLNAPSLLLKTFLNNDAAYEEVIRLRALGTLKGHDFAQITAVEQNESVTYGTGRKLKVIIVVKRQMNKLSKEFIVELRPRSIKRPIIISQLTWNQV